MILYSVPLSPFAAKVRIVCYAKGLNVEIRPTPGGSPKSGEFLAINPLGKIPTLVTSDGVVIPESSAIVEYLEDAYPTPSLQPESLTKRACGRAIAFAAENYVVNAFRPLFAQLRAEVRDGAAVDQAFEEVDRTLGNLTHLWGTGSHAVDDRFTTADASLAPVLYMVLSLGRALDRPDILADHPPIGEYFQRIQSDPAFEKVQEEMRAQAQDFFGFAV